MTEQRTKKIPESKLKIVKELKDLIKNKKTILIASIKNIPASQFQEISKKLRGKAIVKVPKKNLILRALDSSEKQEVKKLKNQIQDSVAILFSDQDSFELASDLTEKTSPARAKPGQEAPEDINVEAGPTELMPGPAISELGALGIPIQIEKGKINIKKSKTIAKKGEKISSNAAEVMGKLDIKPFKVGFIPLVAFDNQEGKLYLDIKVDKQGTLNELKLSYGKSLAFAVEIGYISEGTIKFMIGKAGSHEKALANLMKVEKEKVEEKQEEVKEVEQDKPEVKQDISESDNDKVEQSDDNVNNLNNSEPDISNKKLNDEQSKSDASETQTQQEETK